ncbi:MAG: Biopolymer transport protein ExbB [Deltaproteobacteria bacterium ADurb.Bin510]|nr:MAG: Biopolymer transport protein ExbB [Deltaproteobacteria bacterium ADurb.Bin510]
MGLWDYLLKGGPVMWLLLFCSVMTLTIFFERLWTLRRSSILPADLIGEIERLARMGHMEEAGARAAYAIDRNIDILGIIATIAPLLGLLGTVTGMITSFKALSMSGGVDTQLLSAGIAQALLNTAAGLFIAIPSYVFYRLMQARSSHLIYEMEKTSARILDYLRGDSGEV